MKLWDVLTGKTERACAEEQSEDERLDRMKERLEAARRLAVLQRRLEATQLDRGQRG